MKDKKVTHVCGKFTCKNCGVQYTEQPHFCFLKPKDEDKLIREDDVTKIIVSYDIESTQENRGHKPNLLISKACCDCCFWKNIEKYYLFIQRKRLFWI
jgi:hypothetical protein